MTVKQKQLLLAYLGYYTGDIDGSIGPQSIQAIKSFQRDFGELEVDGRAGEKTCKALKHAVAYGITKKQPVKPPVPAGVPEWWSDIKYFKRTEHGIYCPCGRCGGYPVEPSEKLMRLADAVREAAGVPMNPSSTVRCEKHNAEVGGVPNSRHKQGKAMDFALKGWSSAKTLALVLKQPGVRYAYKIDDSYVHMDVT